MSMTSWSLPSTEIARNRRRRSFLTALVGAAAAVALGMALLSSFSLL